MKNFIEESKRIIRNASDNNKLVLFIGAGVSANSGIPLWGELMAKIKGKLDIKKDENDYLKLAQYFYNSELEINAKPNIIHEKLLELNPQHIITTNYDTLIEEQANKNGMFYNVVAKDSDLPYVSNNKLIIKMHGDFANRNIVFKEDDYLSYSNNFKLIENYVKTIFSSYTVLFVGYSLEDIDTKIIFQWVKDILDRDLPRPYFINVDSEFNINEYEYYRNKGINLLYYSGLDEELRKSMEENNREIENEIGKKTLRIC